MCVGTLTQAIRDKGFRVGDLTVRLWHTRGVDISHSGVLRYCRASDESYGKPEIGVAIRECLVEMGVDWTP